MGNRVEGYLVRFGSPTATDLDGEFFTKATDFGRPVKSGESFDLNLYWHHGLDPAVGSRQIGTGKVKADDVGLWYEGIIAESDEYLKRIQRLAGAKRLGFSSGAAAHLVEKEAVAGTKSTAITRWPLGEASLTHCPAEPTNTAATKSLGEYKSDWEETQAALVAGDATAFASSIFGDAPENLLASGVYRMHETLMMGIYRALESDETIDPSAAVAALLSEFARRASDYAARVLAMPDPEMGAEMDAMKALTSRPDSITTFERRLRDALGYSRREAKALASHGFKALRDAGTETD
ncbi:MAG: HK97 family phage prohead protease, partial [Gemmatimonadetes bacterium]|nr:HK97 family phage prohead protease [Gemmatimonadota bacterium]